MLLMGICILGIFSQTGCALFCRSVRDLQSLEIGMTKPQVMQVMGQPSVARGAIKNKEDKVIEVWTYNLGRPGCLKTGAYLLRFQDGKLSQWGQRNDWLRQPDSVEKKIIQHQVGEGSGLY